MENIESGICYGDSTGVAPAATEETFKRAFAAVVKRLSLTDPYILSVTVVDAEEIRRLNSLYRHIDRPTDVISFAYLEQDDENLPVTDLGEICICLEVATAQANEFSHPLIRELAFLFIHGLLHLLGYDHTKNEQEAEEMYNLQNEILNSLDDLKEEQKDDR